MAHTNRTNEDVIESPLTGKRLLENPLLNKGTAFTQEERVELGLLGLLPSNIETLDEQLERTYASFQKKESTLERYIFLRNIQDINETLYYALLDRHALEMLPIVYTPGVGEACLRFHHIFRQPRGLYIPYPDRDKIDEMLANAEMDEVKVIVVTDGERILGLGDLGASGMGIPIGKISLYTACGGLHPAFGLPITLDCGTDNEERLQDPLYFGWRHARIRGAEYEEFVDLFVRAVKKRFPHVLLQWEDFSKDHAHVLLDKYRHQICSFNDDIQGTAAVTLAGLMAAVHVSKAKMKDQQVVILGAGSAGTGIAHEICAAMEMEGLSEKEARLHMWLISTEGLLTEARTHAKSFQKPYAKPLEMVKDWKVANPHHITLKDVITHVKPTILIGVSTSFGAFNEEVIREMAKHVKRPIIFPLSNPFSKCEAAPEDLIKWTEGRALIATGTKYPDVVYEGKTYHIGQCNNYYIFPAMGLAVMASQARAVSDGMFIAAATALGNMAPALKDPSASLFPDPKEINTLSRKIAFIVAKEAQKEKLAPERSDEELQALIDKNFWRPAYSKIILKKRSTG